MKIQINNIGMEFTFDVKERRNAEKVEFYRELYGYKNYSNFGKYIYLKDGVLSGMKHLKPTKSAIIVSVKNAKELRNFFKKHKVNFDEKLVILKQNEAHELGIGYPNNWRRIYEELKGNENLFFSVDF